jgi:hypothetical protein
VRRIRRSLCSARSGTPRAAPHGETGRRCEEVDADGRRDPDDRSPAGSLPFTAPVVGSKVNTLPFELPTATPLAPLTMEGLMMEPSTLCFQASAPVDSFSA